MKKIKKVRKNSWQEVQVCGIIYKLSPRGDKQVQAVAWKKQIKNRIRKKWDLFDKQANEEISVNLAY